ncbi:hypothetical protein R1sor_006037 [Riccia sorocarpa]|uniref:Uncharacterized protein n=1 Tax=Riccia sorocarpa TaxID=122646 RepID=A0ABD3HNB4_9MARC
MLPHTGITSHFVSLEERLRNELFFRPTDEAVKSWENFEAKLFPYGWERRMKVRDLFTREYYHPERDLELILPGEFRELSVTNLLEICVYSKAAFEVREVLVRGS